MLGPKQGCKPHSGEIDVHLMEQRPTYRAGFALDITLGNFMYMPIKLILTAFILFSSLAIAHDNSVTPQWLKNKMDTYQKSHPYISAQKTEYEGKVAYYIAPRCCDMPSELYNESGELICYPSGGLSGGDGKCPTFRISENSKPKASTKTMRHNDKNNKK